MRHRAIAAAQHNAGGRVTYIPSRAGSRAPDGLGMQVGVQSNPSMTMSPQDRGIRRGGHHLPGCFSDIAKVPNTRYELVQGPLPLSFTKVGEINLTNVGRLQGWVGTLILLASS